MQTQSRELRNAIREKTGNESNDHKLTAIPRHTPFRNVKPNKKIRAADSMGARINIRCVSVILLSLDVKRARGRLTKREPT